MNPLASPPSCAGHIARLDWRGRFASATLTAAELVGLDAAWKADRTRPKRGKLPDYYTAALELHERVARDGLVIICDAHFTANPASYAEFFEPIELASNDRRLRWLGPDEYSPLTWQLRRWHFVICLSLFSLLFFAKGLWLLWSLWPFLVTIAVELILLTLEQVQGWLGERVYVVPGGLVFAGAGAAELYTRRDCVAVVRYRRRFMLPKPCVELVRKDGASRCHYFSPGTMQAFLTAWQSPQLPPSIEQVRELASGD